MNHNPRSIPVKRPYMTALDVRSAIYHIPEPTHFDADDPKVVV